MFNDAAGFKRTFLKVGYTDLRKGISGLTAMIRESVTMSQLNNLTVLEKSCGHCKVWVICVYSMCAHEIL